jgi:hypothetical protein
VKETISEVYTPADENDDDDYHNWHSFLSLSEKGQNIKIHLYFVCADFKPETFSMEVQHSVPEDETDVYSHMNDNWKRIWEEMVIP